MPEFSSIPWWFEITKLAQIPMPDKLDVFEFETGTIPLLVSFPHIGTLVPEDIKNQFTPAGLQLADTDWFVDQLYDFPAMNRVFKIKSRFNRYVIDLNRSTDGQNLYPGKPTPQLCPIETFAGEPIYSEDPPTDTEIDQRIELYWKPYHHQIRATLDHLLEHFGFAMLLDVHSIASRVPRLFDGQLPDFNFGTNNEKSCGPGLNRRVEAFCQQLTQYSSAFNGRFVGGHITRHYGSPGNKIHCVQIELSQATYCDESEKDWNEEKANQVRPVIESFVACLIGWIKK